MYWANSTGRRNILIEVLTGRPAGWMQKLTGRGALRSPGVPSLRTEIERLFWEQVATVITSEKAAEAVGVSSAVGTRCFSHRGGMPLFMSNHISGRYLSLQNATFKPTCPLRLVKPEPSKLFSIPI